MVFLCKKKEKKKKKKLFVVACHEHTIFYFSIAQAQQKKLCPGPGKINVFAFTRRYESSKTLRTKSRVFSSIEVCLHLVAGESNAPISSQLSYSSALFEGFVASCTNYVKTHFLKFKLDRSTFLCTLTAFK